MQKGARLLVLYTVNGNFFIMRSYRNSKTIVQLYSTLLHYRKTQKQKDGKIVATYPPQTNYYCRAHRHYIFQTNPTHAHCGCRLVHPRALVERFSCQSIESKYTYLYAISANPYLLQMIAQCSAVYKYIQ